VKDLGHVLPDVSEGVRRKRYYFHPPSTPCAKGRIDVFEAYGADLAMVLSDNDIGPKRFELLGLDAVDGELSCRMVLTRASMW
jgi:hypothetical protein